MRHAEGGGLRVADWLKLWLCRLCGCLRGRLSWGGDGLRQEIVAEARLEIGDEFLKHAVRRLCDGRLCDGRFGDWRLCDFRFGCRRLDVQLRRSLGFRDRSRFRKLFSCGVGFVGDDRHFFDGKLGGRFRGGLVGRDGGGLVNREFRDRFDGGNLFHRGTGCSGSRFNLSFERRQDSFVGGELLKFFESGRGLLGHSVLEVETDLFDGFVDLFRLDFLSGLLCA